MDNYIAFSTFVYYIGQYSIFFIPMMVIFRCLVTQAFLYVFLRPLFPDSMLPDHEDINDDIVRREEYRCVRQLDHVALNRGLEKISGPREILIINTTF